MTIEFICAMCGGIVSPCARSGRTWPLWPGEQEIPVPDDFDIPECGTCGEQYLRSSDEDELERVLRAKAAELGIRVETVP